MDEALDEAKHASYPVCSSLEVTSSHNQKANENREDVKCHLSVSR